MTGLSDATPSLSSLLAGVIPACVAVQSRLGPGCPHGVYATALMRELRERGIFAARDGAIRARTFSPSRLPGGGLRRSPAVSFDLVVEATLAVELTDLSRPAFVKDTERFLRQFEDRLRQRGLEAGLLVDFDQPDPADGFWLARVKAPPTSAAEKRCQRAYPGAGMS